MAHVSLKNIRKVYGKDIVAVENFNLEIEDKEFVVFVGPSGCGKSTTLRMIAGLEEISGGECKIGDQVVNNVPPKDRDIAMVFQNYALYPHMTVYDNMAFALKLRKVSRADIDKRVREAAEILGITQYLPRKPKALSGGQRQRVAIGRAIVRDPKVFLMDEPLSNLDAKLRNQMRSELIKLRKRVDTTFVYVTHDQTEAMTLGDRIVVMRDGLIQQVGTPEEVYHHPANKFVAGFIGSPQMNFFQDAELMGVGEKYAVQVFGKQLVLPAEKQKILDAKKMTPRKVEVGIRPEHITLAKPDEEGALNAIIEVTEMLGSEMFLHVAIEGMGAVVRLVQPEILNEYTFQFNEQQMIKVRFVESKIHLFDCDSGENLAY